MSRRAGRAFRPRRLALLLLLAALIAPAWDLFMPAGMFPPRERRTIVIQRGQSLRSIALELQRVGVIRGTFGFLALARIMQLDRSIKAGQYSLRLGITVPALLRALQRGMFGLDLITVSEGLTVRETAVILAARLQIPAAGIDSLARDRALLDSLGISAPSLEGYLAPDSYEWLPGTAPEVALRTMVARTRERLAKATAGCDSLPLGMSLHGVLSLASIVESESQARDERPRIARVYLNRLAQGMRLQADPTVGYALGKSPRSRLAVKQLRTESPYNTYLHDGLPPGPVCSPGYSSILAVIQASPGERSLYFVARGDGRHFFAETYAQHLANIQAARVLRAALGAPPDSLADSLASAPAESTAKRAAAAVRTTPK